jgi:hypothetical protein
MFTGTSRDMSGLVIWPEFTTNMRELVIVILVQCGVQKLHLFLWNVIPMKNPQRPEHLEPLNELSGHNWQQSLQVSTAWAQVQAWVVRMYFYTRRYSHTHTYIDTCMHEGIYSRPVVSELSSVKTWVSTYIIVKYMFSQTRKCHSQIQQTSNLLCGINFTTRVRLSNL